jgi:hypothetical protein
MGRVMASIFGGDEFKLADLDFLGDEAELRAKALQELSAAGDSEPRTRHEGTDDTGAVMVSIDRAGTVEAVEVSRAWQERMTPGEFAGALYAAYNAAQIKQVNAAALAVFAAQERGEETTSGPSTVDDQIRMPGNPGDERVWLGGIWSILSNNDDQLHRIERGERLAASATSTVTGPHGFLTAELEDSGIASIRGDAELIKSATAAQLEVEALAVFRSAGQATREETNNGR